ncbi:hypothetical protein [Streptomyces sp. NPDC058084]|uniref:hypothetical protein n=1 Tax=Streptomyces sp. NPDC058084 TaxID=3346333 RepID=UPI0036ECEFE9
MIAALESLNDAQGDDNGFGRGAVVTATEELLNAAGNLEDTAHLEEKLAAFGRAATAPPTTT